MNLRSLFALMLLACIAGAQAPKPKEGDVPTERAGIAIANIVLASMYGDLSVKAQKPFHAERQGDIWEVAGKWSSHPNPDIKGGRGLNMRINKQTGEILSDYFMR